MQQSPIISIEQKSLSVTISHNSSEISLNKINKLEKWRRMTKRIIQFFRFIKIPILRTRFIDKISHISPDYFEFDELNMYDTNKIQEDLLFLDDIYRYHEIFNTLSSFGFLWQDKEFQIVKLKANYIYDHYMSTSESIAKTNIPIDTILFIYNRLNSSKILSSFIYLNLFNDIEKFIIEKLLWIYMREGLNCFSTLVKKQSIPIMNRLKTNQTIRESNLSFEHINKINKMDKSISNRSNMKIKDMLSIEPQYDELIISNWTYSTDLGFVYNPIREKRMKRIKKNVKNKIKDFHSTVNTMIKSNHTIPDEIKLFNSTDSSKYLSHVNNKSVNFISTNKKHNISLHSFQNSHHFSSSHYYSCDNIINKKDSLQKVFICKVHSPSSPKSHSSIIKNEVPYRMAFKPQTTQRLLR